MATDPRVHGTNFKIENKLHGHWRLWIGLVAGTLKGHLTKQCQNPGTASEPSLHGPEIKEFNFETNVKL